MAKLINLVGKTFGRLKVISVSHNVRYSYYWTCICECGNHKVASSATLRNGHTKSCGCLSDENRKTVHLTHGEGNRTTKEYTSWSSMRARCNNHNNKKYHRYGGRGIKVCERWSSYENFLADMGRAPSGKHSIDRIDNNGNYEPGNCRWATNTEQCNNTRRNKVIEYKGHKMTLANWCRKLGLNPNQTRQRIVRDKWSVERAFTPPG